MAQPALKQDVFAPAHEEEHFEAELAHDEPRTPGWLTAVGGVLFLLAIVWFIASRAAAPSLNEPLQPVAGSALQ